MSWTQGNAEIWCSYLLSTKIRDEHKQCCFGRAAGSRYLLSGLRQETWQGRVFDFTILPQSPPTGVLRCAGILCALFISFGSNIHLRGTFDKLELAMIQDTVSNPLIGQMRMQFWRDAVQKLGSTRHPIAVALHDASKLAHIAPYHLKRIVDARVCFF